jgi:dipeptidyl aminopeptidase/acylaminoacyl peptidase
VLECSRMKGLFTLECDREFLESIAPIHHLDRITAPLMVIHGANDPRVPLSEAEQPVTVLEARGVPKVALRKFSHHRG